MPTTRLAITLGLLAASVALSACSQEDYYCDADGCYYCDGLGCRGIDPPGRNDCECDSFCAGGTSCTSLGCANACTSTTDCARGTECRGGFCVHPREVAAVAMSECAPCDSADDCGDEGADYVCVAGVCRPPARPDCDATNPCPSGSTCIEGECRTDEETCRFSSECGPGRICVDQHCTTGCDATTGCPTGAVCTDGFCREQPGTGTCTTNPECGASGVCIDGACWSGCTTAAECGEGRYCDSDGRCRFDDRPVSVCGDGRPCASGAVCLDGLCRSPCETATDCRRFDEQLTFCRELLCYTTNEATSDCTASADCMSGQNCVDGICR